MDHIAAAALAAVAVVVAGPKRLVRTVLANLTASASTSENHLQRLVEKAERVASPERAHTGHMRLM